MSINWKYTNAIQHCFSGACHWKCSDALLQVKVLLYASKTYEQLKKTHLYLVAPCSKELASKLKELKYRGEESVFLKSQIAMEVFQVLSSSLIY